MTLKNDPVARSIREVYPYQVDLENCDAEPLRHIQVVQAFACLLVVDRDSLMVTHASENTASFIGRPWESVLDQPLKKVLKPEVVAQISGGLDREDGPGSLNPIQYFNGAADHGKLCSLVVHQSGKRLLVEIEATEPAMQTTAYQHTLAGAVRKIQEITDYDTLFTQTARILRQLTQYDRVLVYRFDKDYNGEVIAEALRSDLEPFLGLRYPHTDIPAQARELYLKNRVRLISNREIAPSRIRSAGGPETDTPLDLTPAASRGCSPVHLEYLGYMGVNNSLSIAIVQEGKLWGLFALHHYSPRTVDVTMRGLLQFLGQIFSGHLTLQAANRYRELNLTRNVIRMSIGEQITKTRDVFTGIMGGKYQLLDIFPSTNGGAICFEQRIKTYGEHPPQNTVTELIDWVKKNYPGEDHLVWHHDSLSSIYPAFEDYCDTTAGALILFLGVDRNNWICWFRPGITRSITWGGKPDKTKVVSREGTRLGPRQSFARYVQTIEGCSAEWQRDEIEAAYALRITIINGLLQHYSEVKQINEKLKKAYEDLETFSYTVSHDLRSPLRAISGYTDLLEEEYGQLLDDDARHLLDGIQSGVAKMNNFITDILELSRVGSGGLQIEQVSVEEIAQEVFREVSTVYPRDGLAFDVATDLPAATADRRMLRQVFSNLLSNALKYMEPGLTGELAISVDAHLDQDTGHTVYTVSNSGKGIPEEYAKSVFEMFSRLSNKSDKEGTGVGLAIVERIVHRHNGRVWTTNDRLGTTFNFYLAPANQ